MPEPPDTENAARPAPLTRRQLRHQEVRPTPVRQFSTKPLVILATIALSALIALGGFASPYLVAAGIVLAGAVLAWGWPVLLALPSPRGTSTVLMIGTVLCAVAVALTRSDPFLQWVPAALAVAVIAAFAHQLLRRDGRPRLAESVSASAAGLATVSSGVSLVPLPLVLGGAQALACAMAAAGLSALADPCVTSKRLRPWALPIAMVLGGAGAVAVAAFVDRPGVGPAALLGVLVAAVAHAARRVLAVLPAMVLPRAQLAAGAASVLLTGVVVYTVVRIVVA